MEIDHIEQHAISPEEAEYLLEYAERPYLEPIGEGKWRVRGQTEAGRFIQVIYLFDADDPVYVIHARGLTDHEQRQLRRRLR